MPYYNILPSYTFDLLNKWGAGKEPIKKYTHRKSGIVCVKIDKQSFQGLLFTVLLYMAIFILLPLATYGEDKAIGAYNFGL